MTPSSRKKIGLALRDTKSWPVVRRRMLALTAAEFEEAERIERMGQRRNNLMKLFRAIRSEREGRPEKMSRLKVEAKI